MIEVQQVEVVDEEKQQPGEPQLINAAAFAPPTEKAKQAMDELGIREPEYIQVDEQVELKALDSIYGKYTAQQLAEFVKSGLPRNELEQILEWEKANKDRKTVVSALEKVIDKSS